MQEFFVHVPLVVVTRGHAGTITGIRKISRINLIIYVQVFKKDQKKQFQFLV